MEIMDGKETWSGLPMVLLWIIMDRLHYVDRDRLGLVCKHWKHARQNYPFKPRPAPRSVSPWVINQPRGGSLFTIFNPFTMESFTLGGGVLDEAYQILYSKKGWLLFQQRVEEGIQQPLLTVTLFNIHTNTKINLPPPPISSSSSSSSSPRMPVLVASFSTFEDGTPSTVMLSVDSHKGGNNFHIADVRTMTWTEHTVVGGFFNSCVLLVGHKLYVLQPDGILFIYDILTRQWTELASEHIHIPIYHSDYPNDLSQQGLAESENGEILKIEPYFMLGPPLFHLSKLNSTQTGWDEILPHHQPSIFISWYLSRRGNHFVSTNQEEAASADASSGGFKVYDLCFPLDTRAEATIIAHDFMNATRHPITNSPPPSLRPKWYGIKWIDLGSMEKVPSSCLRYDPGTQLLQS